MVASRTVTYRAEYVATFAPAAAAALTRWCAVGTGIGIAGPSVPLRSAVLQARIRRLLHRVLAARYAIPPLLLFSSRLFPSSVIAQDSLLRQSRARTQRHVWLRLAAASDHEPRRHQLVPHAKGQSSHSPPPRPSLAPLTSLSPSTTTNAVELEPDEQVPQLLLPVGRRRRYAALLPSTHGCGPRSLTPGGGSQARA